MNKKPTVRQFTIAIMLDEKDYIKFIKACGKHQPCEILNDLIKTVIDNPIEEGQDGL